MGEVKQINIKNRSYCFYKNIIDIRNFRSNLSKSTKSRTKTLTFTTLDTSQLKKLMIMRVFIV